MTYRSTEEGLRERTKLLEGELDALRAERGDSAKLDREAAALNAKLEKSRILLERFAQKRALPMLDQVRVASPCNASWAEMSGDDKSRYCGKCEKNVYNLSAMTREEAELVMLEKEGDLCIRLYRRTDGTVITADCPVGVRRKRLRLIGVVAVGLGAAAAGLTAALAITTHPRVVQGGAMPIAPPEPHAEMGDIGPSEPEVAPPPPPAQMEQGAKAPPQHRVEMGEAPMIAPKKVTK